MGEVRVRSGGAVDEAARRKGWIEWQVAIAFHDALPLASTNAVSVKPEQEGFEEIGKQDGTLVRLCGFVLAHLVEEELMDSGVVGEFRVEGGGEKIARANQRRKSIARGQRFDAGAG